MGIIGVVNYGCGNIQSVINAIEFLGYEFRLIENEEQLFSCQKVILPGVGAFDHAIEALHSTGLFIALQEWSKEKSNQLLGICLGMQLLCSDSDESLENKKGLSLINAQVLSLSKKIHNDEKIPHMGWNEIKLIDNNIFSKECNNHNFYFIHSYAVFVNNEKHSLAKTVYGDVLFSSMVTNGKNVYGVQFHPEKSHDNGLNLLKDFIVNA
jgi:imidazole glycerol-phosphate synthase subunit HisH